jgi:RNA-splicing ligase RtcB
MQITPVKLVRGLYNYATVYCENAEQSAIDQIQTLCDDPDFESSKICIMPDVHAGAGCTIGTTMTIRDKVVPNMVGVDIGCGMLTAKIPGLTKDNFSLAQFDHVVHTSIPSGQDVRYNQHTFASECKIDHLIAEIDKKHLRRGYLSIGTLGGGNHFIEVDIDTVGNGYVVIHTGSRNLGLMVAKYWQDVAAKEHPNKHQDLAYLEGNAFDEYIHDMKIMQTFAELNRRAILDRIADKMGFGSTFQSFQTIHNYIDMDTWDDTGTLMLRKGAVSAKKDQRLLIPLNMRDGSLICSGKGNDSWNQSAPHGAGRCMSRRDAKKNLTMDEFRSSMDGIYTTTVCEDTIDEAPMAYKPSEDIINAIHDTVDIIDVIKPIYNFKAKE